MAKLNYDRMERQMEESKSAAEGSGINYIRWSQGTHVVKLLEVGNPYDETFYRETMTHQAGSKKDFRKWMCYDWINNDHERRKDQPDVSGPVEGSLKSILIKEGKLTKSDWAKYKKYGCPTCTTVAGLAKIGVAEEILEKEQKKFENLCQIFYTYRRVPEEKIDPKPPACDKYVWTVSTKMRNDIIAAIKEKRMPENVIDDEDDQEEAVEDPLSLTEGCNLMIRAEGEGQFGRKYSIQFKGKPGQKWYRQINKETKKSIWLNPEEFEGYDLVKDVEMKTFLSYQKTIDMTKKVFGDIMKSVDYHIPGDNPEQEKEDDPLYAKQNRQKAEDALSKPKTALDSYNKSIKDEMDADDTDADIDEETPKKKQTKPVPSSKKKTEVTSVKKKPVEEEDFFEVEEEEDQPPPPKKTKEKNSFQKQVPPSDDWDDEF